MDHFENNTSTLVKDRFRDLIEGLNVITYEFDLRLYRFTYVSRMAEAILGYSTQEWFTKGFWYEHLQDEDRKWAVHFSRYNISLNKDHEFEYRMTACDGSVKWFKDIVSIVHEEG
ncbi:MAG TPA: PAS domain-containing protein, partial [Ignavibacteria bacterium]|nr:PAS domain-containing protein [Ignavibacteria bacterium]